MNITDLISFKGNISFLERKGYRTYPLTYNELKERMQKTETYLKMNKVKKGDKIIIQARNSVDYAVLMLACFRLGIIIVPLEFDTSKILRKKIMSETRPKLVFTNLDNLGELTKDLPLNKTTAKTAKDDIAEIVYTSGTTGIPKGVVLTHGNIYSNVEALKKGFWLRLRHISVLPLSHMLEQCCGLFLPLSNNSSILYPHSKRYSDIIDLIRYKKINIITAVPGILEGLKKAVELRGKSFRELFGWQFRIVGVGGASLPKSLEEWWGKRVLLLQGYGLTEASPIITTNLPFKKRKYSIGVPLSNLEVRLKKGEIQVKGPNIMKGYFKKPKETKEAFDNGWFKTGDMGEIKNGFLFFKERKKDIIVTKAGLNIYPQDIEEELNKYVEESCIIEKDGNIHAVLMLDKGDPKKIVEEVNKKLEKHQKIVSYSLWHGPFPKTPTGKIKKYEVMKRIRQAGFKHENKLYELLAESLSRKIKGSVPLTSLGMDSLKRVQIISVIERNFGIELNEQDITPKTTAKSLEELIKKRKKLYHYNFKLPRLGFVGHLIISLAAHLFCRIKADKTAFKGIIAANHVSALDIPVITSCVKTKKYAVITLPVIMGIGAKQIKLKLLGFILKHLLNLYPFGEEVGLENSLRFTGHLLDEGYSIFIFPEGGRTRDGKMQEFKEGVGFLSVNMDTKILPVKTGGLYEILPYYKSLPRFGEVLVKIGKPFTVGKIPYFKAAKMIEKKVRAL